MKRIVLLAVLVLLTGMSAIFGQSGTDELGTWYMYFGQNKLSKDFSIHTEAQFRFYEPASNLEQILLRTGLNYHLYENNMVTAGYAWIYSDDFSDLDFTTTEHRIWQQYIQVATCKRVKFEHRYRLEERWITSDVGTTFKGRARYRVMMFVPLNKKKMEPKTVFAGIYDEVFLDLDADPFDQNRLYGALGYQVNSQLSVQAGFLNQFKGNGDSFNRLQLAVFFNPNLAKSDYGRL